MKRNYYTIHKNKKPKKLIYNKFKYFDVTPLFVACTSVSGASNIAAISTMFDNEFKPYEHTYTLPDGTKKVVVVDTIKQHKELQVFNIVKNTAEAIKKINKQGIIHRFKTTGKYVRQRKN